MSPLSVLLLGPPQVLAAETPIHLSRRKSLALLAYLAGNPGIHPRDSLATLLSPEEDHSAARRNLRRTLSELVRSVGHAHFAIDRQTVRLGSDELTVDLTEFQHLLAHSLRRDAAGMETAPTPAELASLTSAVDLVRGPFLAGFSLRDSVLFDDWQMLQEESIRRDLIHALARLVDGYRAIGEPVRALDCAHRWVQTDPLQGLANRTLMLLLAETGEAAAAVRHFRTYEERLDAELGLPPDAETVQLFDAIRHGIVRPDTVYQGIPGVQAPKNASQSFRHVPPGPDPHTPELSLPDLPRQMTSFVGRQAEVARLARLLCDEPDCRLVTVTGAGGAGKTRLALAAAETVAARFAHGVCYVSLVGVSDPNSVLTAVAERLKLPGVPQGNLKNQIFAFLRDRRLLLLLDNVEQLLVAPEDARQSLTTLMIDLLAAAPDLRILTTSRTPLDIQPEWLLPVAGLSYPAEDEGPDGRRDLETFEAVALFADRARHVCRDFDWRQEWDAVVRICRQVDGLPLAVELAAAWAGSLSCSEIAAQIEEGPHFLTTTMHDVEPRHRSIRRVFEQSWSMLSHEEQQVLSRLAVFRGGFTRLAAEQVAGATLALLSALVSKSLLRRDAYGRYDSQELLRQFCADKLAADADARQRARDRHCAYFTTLLANRYEDLLWRQPVETYRELSAEMDNISAAWTWAVERGDLHALDNAFEVYWQLLDWRGAGEEIVAVFGRAAEALEAMCPSNTTDENRRSRLLGEVLIPHGQRLAHSMGLDERGLKIAERGLALVRRDQPVDRRKLFWALVRVGMICLQYAPTRAQELYSECVLLCHATDDRYGLLIAHAALAWNFITKREFSRAWPHVQHCQEYVTEFSVNRWSLLALELRSLIHTFEGDYASALDATQELIRFGTSAENHHHLCNALMWRALLARIEGRYDAAYTFYREALPYAEVSGVPDREVLILLKLSALARLENDLATANAFWRQAGAMFEKRHLINHASVLGEQGQLALANQDYHTAVDCLRRATSGEEIWLPHDNDESSLALLADALTAAGDADAHGWYMRALHKSREEHALPRALQTLGGLARFHLLNGDPAQALELACLVQAHPVTWHEHRVRAEALIAELEANLPAAQVAAARQWANEVDVWDVVADEIGVVDAQINASFAAGT